MSEKTANQLFAELNAAIVDCLMVPSSWLPENYRGVRSMRKLRSVVNQFRRENKKLFRPGREVNVTFERVDGERRIAFARPERLACLDSYASDVDAKREIQFDVDEDRLYRRQLEFLGAMVAGGIIDAEELEEE